MLERVLDHWPLKLLALLLAFAIWLSVTGETRIVQDFNVPLDVQPGKDRALAADPPTTVILRLRGPETVIRDLDPLKMALAVYLADMPPGEREVPLTREQLSGVPASVDVDFIPDRVALKVERRGVRELAVVPDLVGEPPAGFAFYHARVEPEVLSVEGPESELAGLSRLRTEPILLDQRTESFTERVAALPERPHVHLVDTDAVEVSVLVDRAPTESRFESIPVVLASQTYQATITPPSLRVTLSGPPAILQKLRPDQIRAVADVVGLAPGPEVHHVPVHVDFIDVPMQDLARITIKSVSRRDVAVILATRRLAG